MWLSVLSVWGSLLTLVASQSCPETSENSASWVRLKPLGCKDEESTCPYRITLPSLTVQLPKPFRDLEKMVREMRSLTQMVNQLKEDCRECKERQRMEWNIRTDDGGESKERIQASRGTLNTRDRQQDIPKRDRVVQVTTSRSAEEDTMIISSGAKDINPTALGKKGNISQERNVNPRTTKLRAETSGGPKGSSPSQKKRITESTTAKLTESPLPGDSDSEQPTHHEKHKANTIRVRHEKYPSGTLTAQGKVESIPETSVVTFFSGDVETKQLRTPKNDKILGERQLVTGIETQNNRELEPNMKEFTRTFLDRQEDKEDKEEASDAGLKESRSFIFDDIHNVAKEGRASTIQRPTSKSKGKKEKNDHSASPTKPKQFKPDTYAERDAGVDSTPVNTVETISGPEKSTSPITGRADVSIDVSQINPQTLEIKPGTDAKMDIRLDLSGQETSISPISGITDGIVNVSPTNPQTQDSKNPFKSGTDLEREAGLNSNLVNKVETVSGLKNSKSAISDRANATADVSEINPQTLSSNSQTPSKLGTDSEREARMNSNPVNKAETIRSLETPRLSIPGRSDATIDVNQINPRTIDSNSENPFKPGTDAETNIGMDSSPVNTAETVSRLQTPRSPTSDIPDATVEVNQTNPGTLDSTLKNPFEPGTDIERKAGMDSNPVNKAETIRSLETPRLSISGRADATVDVNQINPRTIDSNSENPFKPGTDAETNIGMDSNPVNTAETVNGLKNSRSPISGMADDTLNVSQINLRTLNSNSQNLSTRGTNVNTNIGMDSNPVNTVETVSRLQTPRSPTSDITDATVGVNQTNPGTLDSTFKKTLKSGTDDEREAGMDSNPVNKVKTISPLETPRLSISGTADSTVDVRQMNPQTIYSDSENPFKPGTDSEREVGVDSNPVKVVTFSRLETPRSPILPKRRFQLKPNRNITKPGSGGIKSSNPISSDTERKEVLRNIKATSLRTDAVKRRMTSGKPRPWITELLPMRTEERQEIPTPNRIKYESVPLEAFGSGGPKNTSVVTDHTVDLMGSGMRHVHSKTLSSPNNELNSTANDVSRSVRPTLATQGIVDDIERVKTTPTVEVLHTVVNHQIKSTSQTTETKPKNPGGKRGQDMVTDTVNHDSNNNSGRDTQPPVVEETKDTDRRNKFKASSAHSNQEKNKKPLRIGSIKNASGKIPLTVVSSERNELNYPTATPYTIKTEIKDKHSIMTQFTIPTVTAQHFMDEDHAEHAKTTFGVKVSNKHVHYRLKNSSKEVEFKSLAEKRSDSDTGDKELDPMLQSASKVRGSSEVADLQPNSLDIIQNRAMSSTAIVIVKDSTETRVTTTSTESSIQNRARDSNPVVMDRVKTSTETDRLSPSSDNAPVTYHKYSRTSLGSAVKGNNGDSNRGLSKDDNNGNSHRVDVNRAGEIARMTEATPYKIQAGHGNIEDNKKPLTVNNMDDIQGLEKQQLLSNCHGQCDLGPTPQPILNTRKSSSSDRDKPPQDCSDFIKRSPRSGVYNVTPAGSDNKTFPVFCDMKASVGGWTLIQHRFDGSISFNRTWNYYKRGFGSLMGEFWLGNDKIHWLTAAKAMVLRIELEDLDGIKDYAQYDHFYVANETQLYRLTIGGYSGTAGNAMQYSKKFNHNQKNFTTPDRDNDQYSLGNCGAYYSSGWWFDSCMAANLNGKYYQTKYKGLRNGIFWGTWQNISSESYPTHERQSFKTVRMMIRPRTGFVTED